MSKLLTVLITTYNRKQRLLAMLQSIYSQGNFDCFNIIIVDNCSPDYDWSSMLADFPKDYSEIITVYRRKYNCGMSCNITSCFQFVDTKWCLFLSDDDELVEGAIRNVLNDIDAFSDSCAIKYSIKGYPKHRDVNINDIDIFCDYFRSYKSEGDFLYLVMVYNMDLLLPHMGLGTTYAYNYVGWFMPIFSCITNDRGSMRLSSKEIIDYKQPDPGTGWGRLPVALGISTFMDSSFNLSFKTQLKLYYLIARNFPPRDLFNTLIKENQNKDAQYYYFEKFYYSIWKPISRKKSFELKIAFYLWKIFKINIYRVYDLIFR